MKLLMLIGNNLQYDTRVKRHIAALAKKFDEVVVAARPIPDKTVYLNLPNVTTVFCEWTSISYPATEPLYQKLKQLGVEHETAIAVPLLLNSNYYDPQQIAQEKELQDILMQIPRWKRLREGTPACLPLSEEMGWTMGFLENAILWAEQVVAISADVVYCNDGEAIIAGYAHKKKYNSRLVFDIHDIFYDYAPGVFPQMHRYEMARIEQQFIYHADVVIGVGRTQSLYIRELYGLDEPVICIPNCAVIPKQAASAAPPKVPYRLYYHGMVDETRGIENMIEAVAEVSSFILVLRCLPSDYLEKLKDLVRGRKLEEKVKFLEPVSGSEAAAAAAKDGDIGVVLYQQNGPQSIASSFSLNNKFIDYLSAGLPVLSYPTQEQAQIIEDYKCGIVLSDSSTKALQEALRQIEKDASFFAERGANSYRAAQELFDWSVYEPVLQAVVLGQNLFPSKELKVSPETVAWENAALYLAEKKNAYVQEVQGLNRQLQQERARSAQLSQALAQRDDALHFLDAQVKKYAMEQRKDNTLEKNSMFLHFKKFGNSSKKNKKE